MDGSSSGEALRGSTASVVDKGLNLISINTELLILITVGFVDIFSEIIGYRPFNRLNELLPPLPNLGDTAVYHDGKKDNGSGMEKIYQLDPTNFTIIYRISEAADTIGTYTAAVSLATHVLLTYPVIMGSHKMLLVPWLVVSLLRSVARELVITVLGIVLCASRSVFYYPCVQYSALQGTQFCFILYFWTSVHNFYYHLDNMNSIRDFTNVIKSINTAGKDKDIYFSQQESVDVDDDDDVTEATLVERAAMAWIAREILETDEEYVTDHQFSQYLAIKATMELRQALKELREKKKTRRRTLGRASDEENEEESLIKSISRERRGRAISLSRREPLKGIPYILTSKSALDGTSITSRFPGVTESHMSHMMDGCSQTVPSTSRMRSFLDKLENQQQKLKKSSGDEHSI